MTPKPLCIIIVIAVEMQDGNTIHFFFFFNLAAGVVKTINILLQMYWYLIVLDFHIEVVTPSPQSTDCCCRHVTLVTRVITRSYVTTTRKPQFSEEDPWSQVESSKFHPMFAGVKVSFHLYDFHIITITNPFMKECHAFQNVINPCHYLG